MNLCHDEVLADIERRVRTAGASLDEIDGRIAHELGVPVDYYFAYLLVWGAIEAYRQQPNPASTTGSTPVRHSSAEEARAMQR